MIPGLIFYSVRTSKIQMSVYFTCVYAIWCVHYYMHVSVCVNLLILEELCILKLDIIIHCDCDVFVYLYRHWHYYIYTYIIVNSYSDMSYVCNIYALRVPFMIFVVHIFLFYTFFCLMIHIDYFLCSYGTLFLSHIAEDITDSPTFSGENSYWSHFQW